MVGWARVLWLQMIFISLILIISGGCTIKLQVNPLVLVICTLLMLTKSQSMCFEEVMVETISMIYISSILKNTNGLRSAQMDFHLLLELITAVL